MEKRKNGILIFLGICILLAGGFIGGGLNSIADNMYQLNTEIESNDTYRVIVQDGIIYKGDRSNKCAVAPIVQQKAQPRPHLIFSIDFSLRYW